ncbi:MAG: class I SAM-dependent methyltransferase [Rhizobiales bacterium]|nr:class I SAM-dependent methyltransferase [Hyphomicrobiales bacterium]
MSHSKGCQDVVLPGFFKGTEMPTAGWWEALWPDPATVLNQVGIRAGMTVVDLCCGDGWFTLQIAKIASRVVAVDIDAKLLDVAKIRLAESGLTNSNFVEGNAYDVAEVVPQPADFVFLANAFHGVPERTRLARAVADALKSGGHFAIVNWHARPREETTILGEPRGPLTGLRITADVTIAAVEPAGFKLVRIVELLPYHYGAIFEKL